MSRQAELVGLPRSSLYYKPVVNAADIAAMNAIDRIFTARPFYGSRRIREDLAQDYRIAICRDHVRRLMRQMGLAAVYPQKAHDTSQKHPQHVIYPYLLRHMTAIAPNHIWGSDITYVPLAHGFCYCYAIIDWFSRNVVGWDISPTLASEFCVTTMAEAIDANGPPAISNTDQGAQFTDHAFIAELKGHGVAISMDGRGRCLDNIFTERLWRSLKYEEVYLKSYADIADARCNIAAYFRFYNTERRHQSLGRRTPADVYANKNRLAPDTPLPTSITKTTDLSSTTAV